ncbi:MAG: PQQ-dependent sugar dehydrogenase, partial [Phycisphaerae bacterium]
MLNNKSARRMVDVNWQAGRSRVLAEATADTGTSRPWRRQRQFLECLETRCLLAATLTPGFSDVVVSAGLSFPMAMDFAPDGRLFVTEKGGAVRIIENGQLLSTPFATVSTNAGAEGGLMGIAFDPKFSQNHYVYVYYTAVTPTTHNRLSRFVANGDTAGPEQILVDDMPDQIGGFHQAGAIHFGADGKLYVARGDEMQKEAVSQELTSIDGKILRYNPDGSIPTDNPFYNQTTGIYRAIYALGFRNPFTFAVQPGTGRIFVNDVGDMVYEDVKDLVAGGRYGWPVYEGPTTDPNYIAPIFYYDHSTGHDYGFGASITGGAFYNPTNPQYPAQYTGEYFFADWGGGWIRVLNINTLTATTFAPAWNPIDLKIGPDGGLYYLSRGGGIGQSSVHEILATQKPQISQNPESQLVSVGQSVTFTGAGSGAPTLQYQWLRDNNPILNENGLSYTLSAPTMADNGATFALRVTNPYGTATSTAATLNVTTFLPPVATITSPVDQSLFIGGQVINFSGTGTDPQDGNLPASAYIWTVQLLQDGAVRTSNFATFSGVTSGSFTVPTLGEVDPGIAYRFILTVQDSAGLTKSSSVDIVPETANLTLATSVP